MMRQLSARGEDLADNDELAVSSVSATWRNDVLTRARAGPLQRVHGYRTQSRRPDSQIRSEARCARLFASESKPACLRQRAHSGASRDARQVQQGKINL